MKNNGFSPPLSSDMYVSLCMSTLSDTFRVTRQLTSFVSPFERESINETLCSVKRSVKEKVHKTSNLERERERERRERWREREREREREGERERGRGRERERERERGREGEGERDGRKGENWRWRDKER